MVLSMALIAIMWYCYDNDSSHIGFVNGDDGSNVVLSMVMVVVILFCQWRLWF